MPALISSAKASSNFSPSMAQRCSRAATPQVEMGPLVSARGKKKMFGVGPASTDVLGARVGIFVFFVVVVVHINRFVHLDPDKHLSHKSPQSICKKSGSCDGASLSHPFV